MNRYSPCQKQPVPITLLGILCMALGMAGLFFYQPEAPADIKSSKKDMLAQHKTAKPEKATCQILTVYDGDTIGCDLNGNHRIEKPAEEIRLLGIDTPEMHYSKKNKTHHTFNEADEPFAKEASELLTRTALRQTAYLTFDEERHDKYGRTLAYVSLAKESEASLCELMLAKGYAKTLFIPPNFRHATHFRAIQQKAKKQHLGLWE